MSRKRTPAWAKAWAKKSTWTVHEFTMLCCGWNPEGPTVNQAEYNRVLKEVTRAIARGELRAYGITKPE